jgi:hypothetical protein
VRSLSIHRTGLLCLAAACAAGACRPAGEAAGATNAGRAAWTAAAAPLLHVGTGNAPGHELDRVYGGVLLPDGGVVIGNSGTGELRFFDRSGALTRTAGRKGRGPGEFQAVSWLRPYRGDSLLAFDLSLQRFSVWTPAGAFARSFQLPADRPASRAVGVFSDGSVLVALEQQPDPRGTEGIARAEFDLVRVDALGAHRDTVGRFAGPEWLLYRRSSSYAATQPPFGRTGHAAVSGESVLYAPSDSGAVHVYGRGGQRTRTIRVPVASRKPGRRELAAALDAIRDPAERQAVRRYTRDLAGASAPAIEDLRVDRRGNVWIRTRSAAPGMSRWMVVALTGEQIGSIDLPSGAMPLDLTDDAMLLRETDGDGVQRVSLRGITR